MINWIEATPENVEKYLSKDIHCNKEKQADILDPDDTDFVFLAGSEIICENDFYLIFYYEREILIARSEYYDKEITHFCTTAEYEAILPKKGE